LKERGLKLPRPPTPPIFIHASPPDLDSRVVLVTLGLQAGGATVDGPSKQLIYSTLNAIRLTCHPMRLVLG
jgi:hypothetical protein